MRKGLASHRVAMAVQPGAPIFELSVPCEVFGVSRPEIHDPWYRFQVCPTTPGARVASGFVADQPGTMRDLAHADTLIIIGSESIHVDPPVQLLDALHEAHRRHSRLVGICSGAFVLARAGLLDHRRATTHWMHIHDFTALFPTVALDPSVLYVARPPTKSPGAWSSPRTETAARPNTSGGLCRRTRTKTSPTLSSGLKLTSTTGSPSPTSLNGPTSADER